MIILPVTYINTNTNNVKTEIITNVNGQETKVESNENGTIKVENINGEVKIESDKDYKVTIASASPIEKIIIQASPSAKLNIEKLPLQPDVWQNIKNVFTELFSNLSRLFGST